MSNEELLNCYANIVAQNAQRKNPATKKEESYKQEILKRMQN